MPVNIVVQYQEIIGFPGITYMRFHQILIICFSCLSSNLSMADSYTFTLQQSSGELSYIASDFHVNAIKHPTDAYAVWHARYNETQVNRMFIHTFTYPMPAGCHASAAQFEIKVTNLGDKYSNDAIGFVERGKDLYSIRIWESEARQGDEKTLIFDLDQLQGNLHRESNRNQDESLLYSLNDGDFSLFVQDDTAVAYVKLQLTITGDTRCYLAPQHLPNSAQHSQTNSSEG
ncbi:hypothetical protein [Marinicella sp. W31]|uniref:hypothetical protein n=1 Tax=Marinicella sp. W31 TaxID=3023713 RepID=UPI003757A3D5